jgi:type II secretory pathway pseudopilin PulG
MNKIKNNKFKKGFTIIEVIIACSIITITVFTLMSAASKGIELSGRSLRQTQANTLLEEGVEAVKTIRDDSWDTISALSLDAPYYLFYDINTNKWSLSSSMDTPISSIPTYPIDDIFSRQVVFSEVYRNNDDDIDEEDGSNLDDGIKKVTVTVSWHSSGSQVSKDLVFYLADIFN